MCTSIGLSSIESYRTGSELLLDGSWLFLVDNVSALRVYGIIVFQPDLEGLLEHDYGRCLVHSNSSRANVVVTPLNQVSAVKCDMLDVRTTPPVINALFSCAAPIHTPGGLD